MYSISRDPFLPTPTPPYSPIIPFLPFELSYDLTAWRTYLSTKWTLSLLISLLYLVTIFAIQIYMKDRAPKQLRTVLSLWNFALAIFSIGGTLRTWPEMGYIFREGAGWHGSVCRREYHSIGAAYWGLLFTLSKAIELGDTIFIVLRKQPLIFLHWYHHITVLTYTWYTYYSYDSTSRWFMSMNYPVHSLMYTYYGLKALRLPVPKPVSMLITFLQLAQMIVGLAVNLYALYVKVGGGECEVQREHLNLALVMYGSYFALFARFFWGAYLGRRERKGGKKE